MPRRNLDSAHKISNDEFYTQYEDVEREVNFYLDFNPFVFKNKVILCPCDDSETSSFTKYFAQNFEKLGLKKLICTSYVGDIQYCNTPAVHGKIFTIDNDRDNSGRIDINDIEWNYLDGDGDFRSEEVKKLRDNADFIITNPPFSLFREFIAWIMEANKKFLILGNQNTITYKDFFPYIMNNTIWLGCRFNERVNGKNLTYKVPNHYVINASEYNISDKGDKFVTVPGTGWFTNIDHGKRHKPLALMTMDDNLKYSKHATIKKFGYRKYDNYDAIDVPFVDAIPLDYNGDMGVPITFLGKYCPDQFEIVKFRKGDDGRDLRIDGESQYFRIIIRGK